jgi:WD40 repeat protein
MAETVSQQLKSIVNADEKLSGAVTSIRLRWPEFPFPGIRPFRVDNQHDERLIFHGRSAQSDEILARLNLKHLVFVLGPSGCGKSSLIKAGVIPSLSAGLLTRAGHSWQTLEMRPGQSPLDELTSQFVKLAGTMRADNGELVHAELKELLSTEKSGLWLIMDQLWSSQSGYNETVPIKSKNILLLIDQFEECFGPQIASLNDVDIFIKLILRFFEKPHPNLYIVITMRTDYIGYCANFVGMSDVINETQYLTPVLRPSELQQTIEKPISQYGGEIDPTLTARLIRDMGSGTAYNPDHLPLMQHALLRLWRRASSDHRGPIYNSSEVPRLELHDYDRAAGLHGLLNEHADEIFDHISSTGGQRAAHITQVLFQCLAERDAQGRYHRTPVLKSIVCEIATCSPIELDAVIKPFEDATFLHVRSDDLIDISHESLIRQWDQFRRWVDEDAERVRFIREIAADAEEWNKHDRAPEYLKSGAQFEYIREQWSSLKVANAWAERFKLRACSLDSLLSAFTLIDDYIGASAHLAERKRRRIRNIRLASAAGLMLLLVAALGVWTLFKRQQAESLQQLRSRTLAERGRERLNNQGAVKGLLVGLAGIRGTNGLVYTQEFEALIYRALQDLREYRILGGHQLQAGSAKFSPKHDILVTVDGSNMLRFWTVDGKFIDIVEVPRQVFRVAWQRDGEGLIIGSRGGQTILFTPCSPGLLHIFSKCQGKLESIWRDIGGSAQQAGSGALSKDGNLLVTGGFNASAKLWDVSQDAPVLLKDYQDFGGSAFSVAFSSNDSNFFTGGTDGKVRVFDTNTQNLVDVLEDRTGNNGPIMSLSAHPSNPDIVLSTSFDKSAKVWSVGARRVIRRLSGHQGAVFEGVFSPDGKLVATVSEDRTARIWPVDLSTGTPSNVEGVVLRGHENGVWSVSFSADGTKLATGASDETARIWHVQPALRPTKSGDARVPKGAVLEASADRTNWTVKGDGLTVSLPHLEGFQEFAAAGFSPDRTRLVAVPRRGAPLVFDVANVEQPVAALDWPLADEWISVGFDGPNRIVAVTKKGQQFSWPYFADSKRLIEFAQSSLPKNESGVPVTLSEPELCRLELMEADLCSRRYGVQDWGLGQPLVTSY